MGVLSIQSHVSMGYVGNSAAVFTLQRMGHEVWPVHTLLFSNHPGHGDVGGQMLAPALLSDIVAGLSRRGVPARCEALLSGYLGQASSATVVAEALALVKTANPDVMFVLDPVIGDKETGVFVADDVIDVIRNRLLGRADIVTPNVFELQLLAGESSVEEAALMQAVDRLRAKSPCRVLVTGIEAGDGSIGTLLVGNEGAWQVDTPMLELGRRANGAGDFLSASFLGHLLQSGDPVSALERAVSSVFAVLSYTASAGLAELDLIRSQTEWMTPSRMFSARRLRDHSKRGQTPF